MEMTSINSANTWSTGPEDTKAQMVLSSEKDMVVPYCLIDSEMVPFQAMQEG